MRERKQNTVPKLITIAVIIVLCGKKRTVNFRPIARKTYIGSY